MLPSINGNGSKNINLLKLDKIIVKNNPNYINSIGINKDKESLSRKN